MKDVYRHLLVNSIAEMLLVGSWYRRAMVYRVDWMLDAEYDLVISFVDVLLGKFPQGQAPDSKAKLVEAILDDYYLSKLLTQNRDKLRLRRLYLQTLTAEPAKFECDIPLFEKPIQLAAWLRLSSNQLKSYASDWCNDHLATKPHLGNYHYHWINKTGWIKKSDKQARLIEAPKQRMKTIQVQIHRGILEHIPLHPACHGFRKAHSCLTYAAPHAGKEVVLHMDLKKFFTSITKKRIHAIFSSIGYSKDVAKLLAGLCTHSTPHYVIKQNSDLNWGQSKQFKEPHLPQGSPSSPTLANLCAYKLDLRLSALAEKFNADYTRYADDMAFSGGTEFAKHVTAFITYVAQVSSAEGFAINHRKTSVMRQDTSQRLTGMTLNSFPNYPRKDFDLLKATLYNCVQTGPASQNRNQLPDFKAHLQGKIAYVNMLNPSKANKLQKLFSKIIW